MILNSAGRGNLELGEVFILTNGLKSTESLSFVFEAHEDELLVTFADDGNVQGVGAELLELLNRPEKPSE